MKKSFLRLCIVLAGLWVLIIAAITVYFHAVGNPLDSSVVAVLIAPCGVEFGAGALIQMAKVRADAEQAKAEAEQAKAEAEAMRGELEAALKPKPKAKAAKGPDIAAIAGQLQIALDALNGPD